MTTLFVACAVTGFAMLLVGFVAGEALDGLLDVESEIVSVPVLGAFLGAFGIGGLLMSELSDDSPVVSLGGAVAGGVVFGLVAVRLSRAFLRMPTDATVSSRDFMGEIGRVVTPISRGRGEVLLRVGGVPQKLAASCDDDVEGGAEVVVIEVLSPSHVRVIPASELIEELPS